MYSIMITPVCTETPKSARNPTPDETLKCVPVSNSASRSAERRHRDVREHQQRPFERVEHRVQDDQDDEDRDRHDNRQSPLRSLLALVLARPIDVVPGGSLTCCVYLLRCLLDRAAEVAPAHAVLDRHIARVAFAIDLDRAVGDVDIAELRERHAFARGASSRMFSMASFVSRYGGR